MEGGINWNVDDVQYALDNIEIIMLYLETYTDAMPDDGSVGPQGPTGPTGPQGPEGPRGPKGPPAQAPPPPSSGGGGSGFG